MLINVVSVSQFMNIINVISLAYIDYTLVYIMIYIFQREVSRIVCKDSAEGVQFSHKAYALDKKRLADSGLIQVC